MVKPTCNGVKMYREEKDLYLKPATQTLAYTSVRYSVSYAISDPSISSCD